MKHAMKHAMKLRITPLTSTLPHFGTLALWHFGTFAPWHFGTKKAVGDGGDLLSHTVARAVPSAQTSLTAVFGMGTGVASLL